MFSFRSSTKHHFFVAPEDQAESARVRASSAPPPFRPDDRAEAEGESLVRRSLDVHLWVGGWIYPKTVAKLWGNYFLNHGRDSFFGS